MILQAGIYPDLIYLLRGKESIGIDGHRALQASSSSSSSSSSASASSSPWPKTLSSESTKRGKMPGLTRLAGTIRVTKAFMAENPGVYEIRSSRDIERSELEKERSKHKNILESAELSEMAEVTQKMYRRYDK